MPLILADSRGECFYVLKYRAILEIPPATRSGNHKPSNLICLIANTQNAEVLKRNRILKVPGFKAFHSSLVPAWGPSLKLKFRESRQKMATRNWHTCESFPAVLCCRILGAWQI